MWSLLDRCINTCLDAHTFCQQDYDENLIPTRLIDIGSDSCPRIKVINTVNTPQSSRKVMRYIALSHRWGTSKFFTLKESNILQCSQEIDLDALPQTFKDTVDVSRLLGYRYVWIDSLCIVRDSTADWERESATMGQVYRNSIFNIAASESDGPRYGLFKKQEPSHLAPFEISFQTSQFKDSYICYIDSCYHTQNETLLSTRGWVLQERLLSPRTIHFGSRGFWECRELIVCPARARSYKSSPRRFNKIWPTLCSVSSTLDALELWEHSVFRYTRYSSTKASDKLIAISGVARAMQCALNEEYLAGLWKGYLVRGIAWSSDSDLSINPKPFKCTLEYRGMRFINLSLLIYAYK
jgi:hypothetical protein